MTLKGRENFRQNSIPRKSWFYATNFIGTLCVIIVNDKSREVVRKNYRLLLIANSCSHFILDIDRILGYE